MLLQRENIGGPVIFQWIECLREIVNENKEQEIAVSHSEDNLESLEESEAAMDNKTFNIITGPPIQDRKSTFQGHFCEVKSQNDVRYVLN